MIALLLAAQLAAQNPLPSQVAKTAPGRTGDLIQLLPRKGACLGSVAHVEASFAQPAALYRRGDRPPRALVNWADYPDGQVCVVEAVLTPATPGVADPALKREDAPSNRR